MAVLLRYASALLIVPMLLYLGIRWHKGKSAIRNPQSATRNPLWLVPPFAIALLPQALYLLTHDPGLDYGAWASGWSISNVFSSTVSGPDGISTYDHPMIVFFLVSPVWDSAGGFLSFFYLPALTLGLMILVRERRWAVLALLLSWWLVPALFLSGTPYQAHRLALIFLPVLAVLIGIGGATAIELAVWMLRALRRVRHVRHRRPPTSLGVEVLTLLIALPVMVGMAAGAIEGWRSARAWVGIHASFKVDEQRVISLAHQAVATSGEQGSQTPRVVCFGFSAPLYHYTGWPILELYLHDETQIAQFLEAPGPHLVILPEESLAGQWANTTAAARWRWLRSRYTLNLHGKVGAYSVYTVTSDE